jgi:hypothetical protein
LQELQRSGGVDIIADGGEEKLKSLAIEGYNPVDLLLLGLLILITEAVNRHQSITRDVVSYLNPRQRRR